MCTNVLTDREYLGITIPFMLSTMTQPLMGAVNTAVMGQLPDPKYIAAVALGAILFNNIYWFLVFCVSVPLDMPLKLWVLVPEKKGYWLFKAAFVALIVGCGCIIFQKPILTAYLALVAPAADVAELCAAYYNILIWELRWCYSTMYHWVG